jgi:hypothetical protein
MHTSIPSIYIFYRSQRVKSRPDMVGNWAGAGGPLFWFLPVSVQPADSVVLPVPYTRMYAPIYTQHVCACAGESQGSNHHTEYPGIPNVGSRGWWFVFTDFFAAGICQYIYTVVMEIWILLFLLLLIKTIQPGRENEMVFGFSIRTAQVSCFV